MTEPNQLMFQAAIQRILPHRYPFLLVDRVTEFIPGERIAGVKLFPLNDESIQGQFPTAPIVPSGILLEMVTQLGAILVLGRPQMADKIAVILQIPSARMFAPILPGDALRVVAEVVRLKENFGELKGSAYRDGERVAEGQMRFAIADKAQIQAI